MQYDIFAVAKATLMSLKMNVGNGGAAFQPQASSDSKTPGESSGWNGGELRMTPC